MKDRPIVTDGHGVRRFKSNQIVGFLLDEATAGRVCDLNAIWSHGFSKADMREFYQMIGYSLSGYGEIFPYTKER